VSPERTRTKKISFARSALKYDSEPTENLQMLSSRCKNCYFFLIINITISLNVIGLKDDVFSY